MHTHVHVYARACRRAPGPGHVVGEPGHAAEVLRRVRAEHRVEFEAQLDALDAAAISHGGAFLCGAAFSLVDAMYIPMMERWAVQSPISGGVVLRPSLTRALSTWARDMSAALPPLDLP